jgi:hypothetical protein
MVCWTIFNCCLSPTILHSVDSRSYRHSNENDYTVANSLFDQVHRGGREYDAWFCAMLRMTRQTFSMLSQLMKQYWVDGKQRNFHYSMEFNLAVTLMYLGSAGELGVVATAMGCSKATAMRCVCRVTNILCRVARATINFRKLGIQQFIEISEGFQALHGIPGVIGAIDGCLIEIQPPFDFEGWYCQKGYPAINIQAICDHKMRFISNSLMSGSHNDKKLWSHSIVGMNAHRWISAGYHFIGDSGYSLLPHLIIPYSMVNDNKHAHFNYTLSATRMKIECAFGVLKN